MSEKDTSKDSANEHAREYAEKAVDALSDNKGGDWKKALAGALDEERLLCALVVLCIFYIGLTVGNAYHDNNKKDEDKIVDTCSCKREHRDFYIGWSVTCYILWFICHSVVLFHNNPMLLDKLKSSAEVFCCIRKITDEQSWEWKCCHCITCKTLGKMNTNGTQSDMPEQPKNKDCSWIDKQCEKIDHCKYHLWTQYYELYVIGITKNSEGLELNRVLDKIIKEAGKKISSDNTLSINHESNKPAKVDEKNEADEEQAGKKISGDNTLSISQESNKPLEEDKRNKVDKKDNQLPPLDTGDRNKLLDNMEEEGNSHAEITTALPHQRRIDQLSCSVYIQTLFYYVLGFIRYIAQLAVIPLLMIQILDTYAYLCFTADDYCSMNSQYKLHLDQTAMTFAFYCSLMISLLSSTMLRWFPLPKSSEPSETEPPKNASAANELSQVDSTKKIYFVNQMPSQDQGITDNDKVN